MRLVPGTLLIIFLTCCASHKGAVEPNAALADFDKFDEAYYLSINQVQPGDSKNKVREEYGDKFRREDSGENSEIWIFTSYRATFARDPIDKYVHVRFSGDQVVSIEEVAPNGERLESKGGNSSAPKSVEERLKALDRLKTEGLISEEEYHRKRADILSDL